MFNRLLLYYKTKQGHQLKTDSVILYIIYSSYCTHFGVLYNICVLIAINLNPVIIHDYLRIRQFIQ